MFKIFFLNSKNCPLPLRTFLTQTALKRTLAKCKNSPKDCGFDEERQGKTFD